MQGSQRSVLTQVVQEVLGNDVDLSGDFFDAGGDSVVAVELSRRVEEIVGHPITYDVLWESSSLNVMIEGLMQEEPSQR